MNWTMMDTWIVTAGVLSAVACALPGAFLVMRRMSMMGDAISHAVLPGLAIAFLISHSRGGGAMFIGAIVVGLLTALFTQWITHFGKVDEGASMGVVFTMLFAIGLIIIVRAADHVDLDPGCVLYGAIELVPLDTLRLGPFNPPRVVFILGLTLLLNSLFIALFYKELLLTSFDPGLANTLGINANLMHYLLMISVAVTTVACFESVGSILVIAMLIVPAATASLLTDRLGVMLLLSVALAALAAVLGHVSAILAPTWFGFDGLSTNTSGMMAVVAGLGFAIAMLLSPRHGLLGKLAHRLALGLATLREDMLGLVYRLEERDPAQTRFASTVMREALGVSRPLSFVALRSLVASGHLKRTDGAYHITPTGRDTAAGLVRTHRLWELYLHRHLNIDPIHIHATAEQLEHLTSPAMQRLLEEAADRQVRDPHGRPIPPGDTPAS